MATRKQTLQVVKYRYVIDYPLSIANKAIIQRG